MDDTMRSYLTDCMQKQVPASFDGYNKYVQSAINSNKQLTASTKAVKIGMQALATVSNMFIGMAISWGISKIFEGIDNLIHAEEKIKEKAKEAQQAIDDVQNSLKNVTSTVEENRDRFIELSEGVDKFSKNLTLSEEEYKEYLSISQQLAEIFPELVVSYDEQGNALINIGDNAKETNAKLNELLETEKQLAKQTLIDNMDDVAKGVAVEAKDLLDDVKKTKNEIETLERQQKEDNFDLLNSSTFTAKQDSHAFVEMKRALEKAGVNYNELEPDVHYNMLDTNVTLDYSSASKEQLEAAQEYYDNYMSLINKQHAAELSGLKRDLAQKEALYNNHYSKMTANLQAWVSEDYNYQYLSDSSQKIIDALIPNIDWTKVNPQYAGDYQKYITDNILNPLMSVPEEQKHKVDAMFAELFSFEPGELGVVDFALELQKYLKELGVVIDITPIISDEKETKYSLERSINNIVAGSRDKNGQLTLSYQDIANRTLLEDYTKDFTAEQANLWLEVTRGINDAEEAIRAYEKALSDVNKASNTSTITDTVKQMSDKLEPQFSKMGEVYQKLFSTDSKFNSNIVDNAMLEGLRATFTDIESELGISFDTAKLEKFFSVLGSGSFTAKQAKDAFNELATAWFYGTDILDNLNEKTADTMKQSLEQMGVTNADEIINHYLDIANAQDELIEMQSELEKAQKGGRSTAENEAAKGRVKIIEEEIDAYYREINATEEVRTALFKLQYANSSLAQTGINTQSDCQQLLALARTANVSAEVIEKLVLLEQMWNSYHNATNEQMKNAIYQKIQQTQTEIENMMADVNPEVELKYDANTTEAAKAGADGADAYLEAFEKELQNLQSLRDAGLISERDYLTRLRVLYEKYFKDKLKYEKEFHKYQREYLEGYKALYESVFSAITSIIDDQIESYEEQKEIVEEYYNSQIEKIDEQIEKINKSREAREDEMAVQKALYDLIRANNQRTVKTLDEYGNTVYKADQSSVRDSQDNYQNAKDDYAIKKLEKKREEYEKLKEESNKYYENLIKGLEDYRERWEELLEMEERAKMLALLEEFGYTEQDILNMSEKAFEDLKIQYLQVVKDMYSNNGNVLKHLSDVSGVDMSSLEGHLQSTADITLAWAEALKDVNYTITSIKEALKKPIDTKAITDNPYITPDNPPENDDEKSKDDITPAQAPTSSKSIVTTDGAILTPVNNLSLKAQSLDIGNIIPNNSLSQISSNIASQIAKAIKVDTTKTVQLTQQVTINAPYLTNESGYNRLMDEFKGLSSAAYINSINNKN